MFNIIPIVLALLALAAILFVIIRKFPDIAVMDIEEIPKEQQGEVKKQILETRIERKFKDRFADVTAKFVQRKDKVKESIDTAKEKLQKMEAEYKKKSEPEIDMSTEEGKEKVVNEIDALLAEGERFYKDENFEGAEKSYLEVLNLEAKNIDAYHGIAELYVAQKEYELAKQTYAHIMKLDPQDSRVHYELAEIAQSQDDLAGAMEEIAKALEIAPNNPKYLDYQLDLALLAKKKRIAQQTLKKIQEVNPENQNIAEWEEKIAAL